MYPDCEIISGLKTHGSQRENIIRFLYREYFPLLGHFICTHNGTEEDARDMFQEVILAFINLLKEEKFRGEASVKTFLFAMNRNFWLNELKKRDRALKRENHYAQEQEEKTVPAEAVEWQQFSKTLQQVLQQLGDNCYRILVAYYYENRSMKEILELVQYENEQVLRNKKSRCMKKLQVLVNENPSIHQQLKLAMHG